MATLDMVSAYKVGNVMTQYELLYMPVWRNWQRN